MKWIDRIAPAILCAMAFSAIALGTSSAGHAQETAAERRRDRLPDALPPRRTQDRQVDQNPSRFKITLPTPVSPPSILHPEVRPIDLDAALRLAGVQNPEFNLARQRVIEAVAMRQFAAAQILPSINPGMNYDSHTGNLQQSNGNILSVQRSALYVGAGSNAVAAGTVNIPGICLGGNTAVRVFTYLESRQLVRQRQFESVAVRNQVFLRVALAYSELLRAETRRAVTLQALEEVRTIARLTAAYAETGQGRLADANRAATERQRREALLKQVEAEILTASARLCELLNLDPSIRLHPTDAYAVHQPLVPDPIPVAELLALGLLRRPELAARRASIIEALLALDAAKALPFSPTFYIGFSAGGFGGGSNLVRPIFGAFGGRTDFDTIAYWTLQNLGVGNAAIIRGANANLQISRFQELEVLNMVREQIAEAYARTHARFAQIATNESAIQSGLLSFKQDLDRILARQRDVLPIELLDSFRLTAAARLDYVDAIVDYNRAQFELYVALGQPPANSLARPVPTSGVAPSGVNPDNPMRRPPAGAVAPARTSAAGALAPARSSAALPSAR